ncbi:MAG: formate--tetrahydrofolate ligase [Armatimonadetes bacterium]|nr:formate--tetrahydrofolate ligase [Armatimonadota bacterium]
MSLRPIQEVAAEVGLTENEIERYGRSKAKVRLEALTARERGADGTVILVTAINPTPAGEGKTVTTIGLSQGLRRLGHNVIPCLREPSAGPVFGMKGGATGGGKSTVEPSDDINLHFNGDFHAITAANNLLSALIDNHLYWNKSPKLNTRRIAHQRVLDMNDRSLRQAVVGLGTAAREESFAITAASEVMAILGLSRDLDDLRERLSRIIVGPAVDGALVRASDLRATGPMSVLLKEALLPNLVQTVEGGPAFVHTGPFGNIAHGTTSIVSLRLARKLAKYVVVEAGFGSDLGAEKFVDIVGHHGGPRPQVAVLVATVRALKYQAGIALEKLGEENLGALAAGSAHLAHHIGIVRRLGLHPVVCVNRFPTDTEVELNAVVAAAREAGARAAISEGFGRGGEGTVALAGEVLAAAAEPAPTHNPVYATDAPLADKIRAVAKEIYGAADVAFADKAKKRLEEAQANGFGNLPICMAKTQYSLSDDPKRRGAPTGFTVQVRDAAVRGGAGFVLVLSGEIMTMPALPAQPNAWQIDLGPEGEIRGIR